MISREAIMEHFDPSVIMNFVSRLLLNFSGVVTNVFVLILAVIFMLLEAPTMKHKLALVLVTMNMMLSRKNIILIVFRRGVISYLGVKTVISLLTGITTWILLDVAGVQYAILWTTLTFLLKLYSEYWFDYCSSADYCSSVIAEWIWCRNGRNRRYYCIEYCVR